MKKSILALFLLLTLASHGTWCAAERTKVDASHLRPHLDVQELHETEGKKLLEMQSPRKLGHGQSLTHHEEFTAEKHPRRMAMGHKGGSMGGGGSGGSSSVGGGGAASATRPHNTKSAGAVALPVPMTSILTLLFTSAIVLSAFSF